MAASRASLSRRDRLYSAPSPSTRAPSLPTAVPLRSRAAPAGPRLPRDRWTPLEVEAVGDGDELDALRTSPAKRLLPRSTAPELSQFLLALCPTVAQVLVALPFGLAPGPHVHLRSPTAQGTRTRASRAPMPPGPVARNSPAPVALTAITTAATALTIVSSVLHRETTAAARLLFKQGALSTESTVPFTSPSRTASRTDCMCHRSPRSRPAR